MRFSTITGLLACVLAVNAAPETGQQCGPRVISLATGIRMNIVGQMAELNATESLLKLESSPPFAASAFEIGKGKLISDIAAGIRIRTYNLDVAPADNPARPGLHKYMRAQAPEKAIALALTGVPAHDVPMLKTLRSDIMAGIKLNTANLEASTSRFHCSLGFDFPPFP